MQRSDNDSKQQGYDARKNMRQEKENIKRKHDWVSNKVAVTALEPRWKQPKDRNRTGRAMMQR